MMYNKEMHKFINVLVNTYIYYIINYKNKRHGRVFVNNILYTFRNDRNNVICTCPSKYVQKSRDRYQFYGRFEIAKNKLELLIRLLLNHYYIIIYNDSNKYSKA